MMPGICIHFSAGPSSAAWARDIRRYKKRAGCFLPKVRAPLSTGGIYLSKLDDFDEMHFAYLEGILMLGTGPG